LLNNSIWAITWLVKELDITNDGWPVAQPRFIEAALARTMMECPSSNTHSSTCGLMLIFSMPGTRVSRHVDLVVEVPM